MLLYNRCDHELIDLFIFGAAICSYCNYVKRLLFVQNAHNKWILAEYVIILSANVINEHQMVYNILFFLLLLGLKCHCDICSESNNTCETDGYCFASTSLDKDGITYAYRYIQQAVFHIEMSNCPVNPYCLQNHLQIFRQGVFFVSCILFQFILHYLSFSFRFFFLLLYRSKGSLAHTLRSRFNLCRTHINESIIYKLKGVDLSYQSWQKISVKRERKKSYLMSMNTFEAARAEKEETHAVRLRTWIKRGNLFSKTEYAIQGGAVTMGYPNIEIFCSIIVYKKKALIIFYSP